MADLDFTVLDHIENVRVPENPFRQPTNEYWALLCLRDGLEFLYGQAVQCDEAVKRVLNCDERVKTLFFGNHPALSTIPSTLLTCAFHWYAISACQYVRTVGAIAYRQNNSRPLPLRYVETIIPEVLAFRDKVAAHFAWATQNNRDNDAERLASVLPPLSFINDSFHVGGLTVSVRRGNNLSSSDAIQPWSICHVHEQLRKRYWPEAVNVYDTRTSSRDADQAASPP